MNKIFILELFFGTFHFRNSIVLLCRDVTVGYTLEGKIFAIVTFEDL